MLLCRFKDKSIHLLLIIYSVLVSLLIYFLVVIVCQWCVKRYAMRWPFVQRKKPHGKQDDEKQGPPLEDKSFIPAKDYQQVIISTQAYEAVLKTSPQLNHQHSTELHQHTPQQQHQYVHRHQESGYSSSDNTTDIDLTYSASRPAFANEGYAAPPTIEQHQKAHQPQNLSCPASVTDCPPQHYVSVLDRTSHSQHAPLGHSTPMGMNAPITSITPELDTYGSDEMYDYISDAASKGCTTGSQHPVSGQVYTDHRVRVQDQTVSGVGTVEHVTDTRTGPYKHVKSSFC